VWLQTWGQVRGSYARKLYSMDVPDLGRLPSNSKNNTIIQATLMAKSAQSITSDYGLHEFEFIRLSE
jgi:hypothetical protein